MCLSTLTAVKNELGISGSGEDTALTQYLREASFAIRAYTNRYLGGVISAISAASPAVVTSIGHGMEDGESITIFNSDSGVTIDGAQTITYIDDDSFSVAVDNSAGSVGTTGTYARTYTEYYNGTGTSQLWLRERPVHSISSIYEDRSAYWNQASTPFASATLLTSGTDYALQVDNSGTEASRSGLVWRIGTSWPSTLQRRNTLASAEVLGLGNIKVTYVAGYLSIPWNVRRACHQVVGEMRLTGARGPMQSETVDYYTYQRMSAAEANKIISGARALLAQYVEVFV